MMKSLCSLWVAPLMLWISRSSSVSWPCMALKTVCWHGRSYLSDRSQCLFIEGCLSEPLPLECGVPQGSILAPLLYILYTNDLPEAVHQDSHPQEDPQEPHPNPLFHTQCHDCGDVCLYADDSTYTILGCCPKTTAPSVSFRSSVKS